MVVLPLSSTSRGRSRLVQWFSGSALALCYLPSSPVTLRSWPLVKARCICRRWVCINQFANVPAAGSYAYIRRTSDRLCKEHGLSVVKPGKDKGKKGKVLEAMPAAGKVVIEGINVATCHVKPKKQGDQGGIINREIPMYASKVMLVCPKCGKPTRIAHKITDGKKVRVCKKCGAEL